MANAKNYILSCLLLFFGTQFVSAQNSVLDAPFDLELLEGSIIEILDELERANDIRFSYNTKTIDLNKVVLVSTNANTLRKLLLFLFEDEIIPIETTHRKIILVPSKDAEYEYISGFVKDSLSGEPISLALVIDKNSDKTYFCNNDGYFIFKSIKQDTSLIEIRYLGYKSKRIQGDLANKDMLVKMTSDISFPDIVISDSKHFSNNPEVDEKVFLSEASLFPTLMGEKDLLQSLKKYPAIASGGEGQNGFLVRGGSTDQNLVLLEGVPVYEISHLGGISSILVTDAVRKADFIASGFPAKYGGRISSVVDVQLKEGNSHKITGNVQSSIMGLKAALSGPVFSSKTTFSIAGRRSYFDRLLGPLLEKNAQLNAAELNYNDILGKLTHYITPSNKISISAYRGGDNIDITQNQTVFDSVTSLQFINNNSINWSNQFVNVDWSSSLGSQMYVQLKAFDYRYKFNSFGKYNFEILDEGDIIDREYIINSVSVINDKSIILDANYYFSNEHKLDFGASIAYQSFRPSVSQTNDPPSTNNTDTRHFKFYVDDKYNVTNRLQMNLGLHFSVFDNQIAYYSLEPRFNLLYKLTEKSHLAISGSKMSQNIHLLTNPGIGLPSDLWVPSTDKVRPQTAYEVATSYTYKANSNFNFTVDAFYKKMYNLIDYQSSRDLFFFILNDSDYIPPINSVENWEEVIYTGEGSAYGFEFYGQYANTKFKSWMSYKYGHSNRLFSEINSGESFPHKYDFRHDFNIGALYQFSTSISVSALWVYNTGRRTSLAIEYADLPGGPVLVEPSRNNFKFPDFHHFDLNLEYNKSFGDQRFILNFGVYNIYNRFNTFYLYLVEDDMINTQTGESMTNYTVRQLSIFPLLPKISAELQF